MNTSIHYQVETKYWRRDVPYVHDEFQDATPTFADLAETNTIFKNGPPLMAREAAFNHYFSILDVLYEGLGKEQTTDAQARIDLQRYFDSGNAIELGGKGATFKSSPDNNKGIEIYMVIENVSDKTTAKILIHGIRYLDYLDRFDAGIQESLEGLIKEFNHYKQNGSALHKNVEDLNLEANGGEKVSIIKTPFNWGQLILDYKGLDLFEMW
ncbi:hypothetical protein ES677_00390 [Bizionia gelidisalsuginis]|uniref:Uncharacterized protein n=1 Tax=Bizionia gelidisalsuginis TaxID=291188 RepID=A0ABY3ME29_9FLAO|nr:hypothetical protein [Bizionia gelidisalsuginis]TYC17869.1 hypothetical protein ES677_00390 [Bizionia gelidisalsuginis]